MKTKPLRILTNATKMRHGVKMSKISVMVLKRAAPSTMTGMNSQGILRLMLTYPPLKSSVLIPDIYIKKKCNRRRGSRTTLATMQSSMS